MADEHKPDLTTLTAELTAAYLASNTLETARLPELITSIHAALSGLGQEQPAAAPDKPARPIGVRASIKPDHLVSMIDGKRYKTLHRHLAKNGLTPDEYRTRFDLPKDYPMVASAYSEMRRGLASKTGLGRKPKTLSDAEQPRETTAAPKRGRKPKGSPAYSPASKPRARTAKAD